MQRWLAPLMIAACVAAVPSLAPPAQAQAQQRAYAPEQLRTLPRQDQIRVIRLEYSEQSGGKRIADDQLQFYLDQVSRSNWTFSQIKRDIAQSLAGGPGVGPPPAGGTVRCESRNNRPATCSTPWQSGSRVARQLSSTRCVEGQNWFASPGRVSVQGGCRADFAAGADIGHGRELRCESQENRRRECPTGGGTARLVRQLSGTRCVEGSNWGSRRDVVWVDRGCRAIFQVTGSGGGTPGGHSVSCASIEGRTRSCAWAPRHGRPVLQHQISREPCIEGRTWWHRDNAIWVSGGCRGLFGTR